MHSEILIWNLDGIQQQNNKKQQRIIEKTKSASKIPFSLKFFIRFLCSLEFPP